MLREHPDGLSVQDIEYTLKLPKESARKSLNSMPDAYIDRWLRGYRVGNRHASLIAIWCVVQVPEHCPRPTLTRRAKRKNEDGLNDDE